MGEKLVSIIVPCYNVEAYIDRCVNSLVRQSIGVENLELIFVDDASTDNTLNKLFQWEKKYSDSIIIVQCQENGRQGTARNIGIQYASAPYIGYVDADDWVDENMYKDMYDTAINHDCDVVSCMQGRDWGDGVLCDIKKYDGIVNQLVNINTEKDRHQFFRYGLPGGVVVKLYKKEFIFSNNITYPEKLAYEDNYFGSIVNFELKSYYVIDKVYYHYYYNGTSTVSARNSVHQLDRLYIEELKLQELEKRGYIEEFRSEIMESFLKLYYLNSLHLVFTRFDELPYDILYKMRDKVLTIYPDYKESDGYNKLSSIEKGFLLTLETEMTDQMWQNLANNYKYLIKTK